MPHKALKFTMKCSNYIVFIFQDGLDAQPSKKKGFPCSYPSCQLNVAMEWKLRAHKDNAWHKVAGAKGGRPKLKSSHDQAGSGGMNPLCLEDGSPLSAFPTTPPIINSSGGISTRVAPTSRPLVRPVPTTALTGIKTVQIIKWCHQVTIMAGISNAIKTRQLKRRHCNA